MRMGSNWRISARAVWTGWKLSWISTEIKLKNKEFNSCVVIFCIIVASILASKDSCVPSATQLHLVIIVYNMRHYGLYTEILLKGQILRSELIRSYSNGRWGLYLSINIRRVLRLGSFWFFKFSQISARGVFGCADSKYQLGISDFGHWRALARKRKNQNISVRHTKLDWPHIELYHN